jgi:omega-amidase
MEPQDLKVCLVQADLKWQDVDANLQQFDEVIDQNAATADLIVLPEMFTTGFSMSPEALAEEMDGKAVRWITQKAKSANVAILGSVIIRENGDFYNRLLFALPDGDLQIYDKRHLFRMGNEHNHYSGGSDRLVASYKGWRICPLICYDLRFPVWSRNQNEYDLLIYIASWPAARSFPWRTLLVARAIENQCYVVGVNRVGVDGTGLKYSGDSAAIDSRGEYLTGLAPNQVGIATVTLSMAELLDFRAKFPVMLDGDKFHITE